RTAVPAGSARRGPGRPSPASAPLGRTARHPPAPAATPRGPSGRPGWRAASCPRRPAARRGSRGSELSSTTSPDVSHHRRRQVRAIGLPFLAQRETGREVERAPPIDLALHPDTAPHQVDELGGDRQAEAGAAVAPGHGAVGLDEGGEDRRLLLPWNADSG